MKQVSIAAKVPENKEKGIKEMNATVTVNYPETVKEAEGMFAAEAVLSNAFANWKVTLQSGIRAALKAGLGAVAIQAKFKDAKMGIATAGGRVDPQQAFIALFQSATPEKQAAMIADLKKKAAEAAGK